MQVEREELLAASLANQYLLKPVPMARVARDLCGLQAQFANNPAHGLRFRSDDFSPDQWGKGMVKTWTLRCTLYAIPKRELGLHVSARGLADRPWEDAWGIEAGVKPEWSAFLCDRIEAGVTNREALKRACRDRGMSSALLENVFHGWGGLLREMCERGLIAYDSCTAKHFIRCRNAGMMDRDEARAVILERYFRHLGPGTLGDCAAFTGYGRKAVDEILRRRPLPLRSVHCGGKEYFYLGKWRGSAAVPDCRYLTGFDSLLMAYKDRDRIYDPANQPDVVTNTGIVFPTILVDGRLRARWKRDGDALRITTFVKTSKKQRETMAAEGLRWFAGEVRRIAFDRGGEKSNRQFH